MILRDPACCTHLHLRRCHDCNTFSSLQKFVQREFTYECFCGIKPGYEYELVIRTLPVDYGNPGDLHDSAVYFRYPQDSENPDCKFTHHV